MDAGTAFKEFQSPCRIYPADFDTGGRMRRADRLQMNENKQLVRTNGVMIPVLMTPRKVLIPS